MLIPILGAGMGEHDRFAPSPFADISTSDDTTIHFVTSAKFASTLNLVPKPFPRALLGAILATAEITSASISAAPALIAG